MFLLFFLFFGSFTIFLSMEKKSHQPTLGAMFGKRAPPEPVEQKKEKGRSKVWEHFLIDKSRPNEARCIQCPSDPPGVWLSCKDGATTNIT
jgi:hypothetical protein